MKTVTIRDLHEHTGHWVRKAARQRIVITDRGRKTAVLVPYSEVEPRRRTLRDRTILHDFGSLEKRSRGVTGPDATEIVSGDRERH